MGAGLIGYDWHVGRRGDQSRGRGDHRSEGTRRTLACAAREQGVSLTGLGGLLSQLTKERP